MEEALSNLSLDSHFVGHLDADTPFSGDSNMGDMSVSTITSPPSISHLGACGGFSTLNSLPEDEQVVTVCIDRSVRVPYVSPDNVIMPSADQVYTIVLTGGPCGGKTTALEHISRSLTKKGFSVFCVPEVATILIANGCRYPGLEGHREELIQFEVALLQLQMQLEASFMRVAASVQAPAVLLLDRGLGDPKAYLPDDLWDEILAKVGLKRGEIMGRYDLIMHLETAAKKAAQFYTTSNNAARSESVDEACVLDDKIMKCWAEHCNLQVFDNSTDFSGKLDRVIQAAIALVDNN